MLLICSSTSDARDADVSELVSAGGVSAQDQICPQPPSPDSPTAPSVPSWNRCFLNLPLAKADLTAEACRHMYSILREQRICLVA